MFLLDEYNNINIIIFFIVGICIGSFLNVIIYRLPIILERDWNNLARKQLQLPEEEYAKFSLSFPSSHCPYCNNKIKIYNNIPLISYILLKGRCNSCNMKIDITYPLVELISGILSVLLFLKFGFSIKLVASLIFIFFLIVLTFIDIKHQLLPDILTISLLWIGLLFNLNSNFASLQAAILGTVFAYLFLWILIKIFYLITKREGMGMGDLKLFASLGAWFGINSLLIIIFTSSLIALIFFLLFNRRMKDKQIAFGPYLSLSGILFMLINYNFFWD